MDWSKSYSSTWRVFKVNPATWADGETLTAVDSVSVTKTADGSLLESGGMELSGAIEPAYYRIVMTADQGGELARVDVATLLCITNGGGYDYGNMSYSANGYSVLYPASVTAISVGGYAPAGVNGAEYAAEILSAAINAPVEVEGSFTLNNAIVHELGTSVLDAAWAVLDAGGFVIQIDGRGVVHILPKPTEPALTIDTQTEGLVLNGVTFTSDESEIPNRYIVIDDGITVIASNDDPGSRVSTISRGYKVDEVDTSPTPIDGETLSEYAERRLRELSVLKQEQNYTREYADGVNLYSVVRASLRALDGDFRIVSQQINCSNGITVDEKVEKEIMLYE